MSVKMKRSRKQPASTPVAAKSVGITPATRWEDDGGPPAQLGDGPSPKNGTNGSKPSATARVRQLLTKVRNLVSRKKAPPARSSRAEAEADAELAEKLRFRLAEAELGDRGIVVVAKQGRITVRGHVASDKERDRADKLIRDCDGVRSVDGQIDVRPPSKLQPARAKAKPTRAQAAGAARAKPTRRPTRPSPRS